MMRSRKPVIGSLVFLISCTSFHFELNRLGLRSLGELGSDDAVAESGDWVSGLPHLLHFVPGAVAGSRVRHRVSMIPVGGNLKDKWALCLDRAVVNSKSCCLPYCKHVHAINPDARDIVATLEKVALSTVMPLLACSHSIVVVLTDEQPLCYGNKPGEAS